jgi:choline dehydrogenase-like flavoprotein
VVDRDLRVFAVPNLWICSTSTFPSGASANPTLTLMALALRLGDRLAVDK